MARTSFWRVGKVSCTLFVSDIIVKSHSVYWTYIYILYLFKYVKRVWILWLLELLNQLYYEQFAWGYSRFGSPWTTNFRQALCDITHGYIWLLASKSEPPVAYFFLILWISGYFEIQFCFGLCISTSRMVTFYRHSRIKDFDKFN